MNISYIIKSYKENRTIAEISKETGECKTSICNILKENNIPLRARGKRKGQPAWNKGNKIDKIKYTIELIESGELLKLHEVCIRRHIKRYLLDKMGNRCSICGTEKWNDKAVPLVCDHINGDSTDNRLANFRLICCNCDAQLETYKSKNKGKGRKCDREYRQQKVIFES